VSKTTQWGIPDDVKAFQDFLIKLTVKRKSLKRKSEEISHTKIEPTTINQEKIVIKNEDISNISNIKINDEVEKVKKICKKTVISGNASESDNEADYGNDLCMINTQN
jgi:hypothetical protein